MDNREDLGVENGSESGTDETRRRILLAAAQVFAEKGYARATTRELAAAAGVNEVTLFRHYGRKHNLFAAVIDEYAAASLTTTIEARLTGEVERDLLMMGNHLMAMLLERGDAVRMMLCEAAHFPEVREVLAQNPRALRRALANYLEQQMQRGRIRCLHAEAAAQAFWGMFFAYAISLGLLEEEVSPPINEQELAALFVQIFVQGTTA